MAFRYVDRILELVPGKKIVGIKNVTRTEPFLLHFEDGRSALSPFIVSEAAAQLGGWLLMHANDFDQRAVLLADENTRYPHLAMAGDQIRLEVEILEQDDEVIVSRGRGVVGDKVVVDGECCRGYLLPATEFSDPDFERTRFDRLFRPDLVAHPPILEYTPNRLLPDTPRNSQFLLLDAVTEASSEMVRGFKNISRQEAFFDAHFSRRSVAPAVILLEMIHQAAQFLSSAPTDLRLIPLAMRNARMRKFVEPGDRVDVEVNLLRGDARSAGSTLTVGATLTANGRRVMQVGEMDFSVHAMRTTAALPSRRTREAEASI